jgi:hypothetical protein
MLFAPETYNHDKQQSRNHLTGSNHDDAPQFAGQTKAGLITASAFQDLLNQPGCVGMRINFPLDSNISSNSILHSNFILYT